MKALITGVAGFIGSTLAERLLDRGVDVVGIDCFTDYYPRAMKERNLCGPLARRGFRLVESRIQDADLGALLADRTHVFHLAAQAGVRKSWGKDFSIYTVNNIEATQVLLEACVKRPVERLVYASSSSVYGDNVTLPMRADARLHVRRRRGERNDRGSDKGSARACIQYWWRVPCLDERGHRHDRPRLGHRAQDRGRPGAEGRHASHLRRHDTGADRPGLQ